jgi:protein-tyrosine sulfotransferase
VAVHDPAPEVNHSLRQVLRHLPVLVGGRPLHGPERYGPFFIVGSGRCGSTLLRAMLEAHPDVHIPPENDLRATVRDYRWYGRAPWNVVLRIILGGFEHHPAWGRWELDLDDVFREVDARPRAGRNLAAVLEAVYRAHLRQHKPSAIRWGDKTPGNTFVLRTLPAIFPDLRVIHILRDGRDVVGSFMRIYKDALPATARHWVKAVRAARAFGARHPGQYLEIRYEDLVRSPRETIQGVATFLGLTFDERMLRHHELGLHFGDVERMTHLQGVREAVHQTSIGRWRTDLDATQTAEVQRLLGPTLATLGY